MSAPPVPAREPGDLENRNRRLRAALPWLWLLGLVAAALVSRLLLEWKVPMLVCRLRELTGVPCPLCGGTRAMSSIAGFDFAAALRLNPLVTLVVVLIFCSAAVRIVDRLFGTSSEKRMIGHLEKLPLASIAFGLVALNWLYLILFQ